MLDTQGTAALAVASPNWSRRGAPNALSTSVSRALWAFWRLVFAPMRYGSYNSASDWSGRLALAATTFFPASMIRSRATPSSAGAGNVFHVTVLEKRRRDSSRPPTVLCQVMNMEDEINANRSPSSSGARKAASPQITLASKREAVQYRRFSVTCRGMQRYGV